MLLLISFISPVLMLIVAGTVVLVAKVSGTPIARFSELVTLTAALAATGAVLTFVYLVLSMLWYEKIAGVSAGNAPLGWMFFYGPLGVAFGQFVALVLWWRKRPVAHPNNVA